MTDFTPASIRKMREGLGLTQHELASALGMGRWGWQTVSRWENDNRTTGIGNRHRAKINALLEQSQ